MKILVAEDEAISLELICLGLSKAGYDVTGASSGNEALDIVAKNPTVFSVIITDAKMPGIHGPELIKRCYELNPNLIFILSSGHLDVEAENQGVLDGIHVTYLMKPTTIKLLIATFNKQLSAGQRTPATSGSSESAA